VIVETDRQKVFNRIQTAFAREFERYVKLKESDILRTDYEIKQGLIRLDKYIKISSHLT
jgi:hypothetical protein